MASATGIPEVKSNIDKIMKRREAAAYALCAYYASLALQLFKRRQAGDLYWTNRTGLARDTVFASAYRAENEVGWYIAHMMEYGVHLELKNNRKHEALRPIIERYASRFMQDMRTIYGDAS